MSRPVLNIAHRGYSAAYPENTLRAFDEAFKVGADGFECDLRLTSDGRVVVFHDDNFKRLCGVSGSVETSTLQEVKKLLVKNQEPIPTLEEMLTTFHTARINLEIKPSNRVEAVVEYTLRELSKVRPQGEILFSSFSLDILHCLRTMDETARLGRLGLLVESGDLSQLIEKSKALKPDTWNVPKDILKFKDLDPSLCPPLWVWTVDDAKNWQEILSSHLPFAAIITNEPGDLNAFLSNQSV